jgi:hypothetical protein
MPKASTAISTEGSVLAVHRNSGRTMTTAPECRISRALPNWSASRPASGITATRPAGPTSSEAPSSPSVRCSPAFTPGIRATHMPSVRPRRTKYTSTAALMLRSALDPPPREWPPGEWPHWVWRKPESVFIEKLRICELYRREPVS